MARHVVPAEMPATPDEYTGWRRSLRRGSVFHLHSMGLAACRSIVLDRHNSESPRDIGDIQYWGCCARCVSISKRESANV
jgi:hypothetical protein